MTSVDARVLFLLFASRRVGHHVYIWGGESAAEGGFDCSGFVSVALAEAARAYPKLYDGQRRTAAGLLSHFSDVPQVTDSRRLAPGSLVFFSNSSRPPHHVKIHVANVPPIALEPALGPDSAQERRSVGALGFDAGGAGSAATSPREALRRAAGVRLSASDYHGSAEWVAVDPFQRLES